MEATSQLVSQSVSQSNKKARPGEVKPKQREAANRLKRKFCLLSLSESQPLLQLLFQLLLLPQSHLEPLEALKGSVKSSKRATPESKRRISDLSRASLESWAGLL